MDAPPAAPDTVRVLHQPCPAGEPRSGTAAEYVHPLPKLGERQLRPLRRDRRPRPPVAPLPFGQRAPALHNKASPARTDPPSIRRELRRCLTTGSPLQVAVGDPAPVDEQ